MLAEAAEDVQKALEANDERKRLYLKEHVEGDTRYAYLTYLKLRRRIADAHVQLEMLQSDPEYGTYSNLSADVLGLDPVPQP